MSIFSAKKKGQKALIFSTYRCTVGFTYRLRITYRVSQNPDNFFSLSKPIEQVILDILYPIEIIHTRELVIVENISQVCLLDLKLTGVKTNAKLTTDWKLRERVRLYSELSVHSNTDTNICVDFPGVYSLKYNFSDVHINTIVV